jgi:hypothetical protein
VRCLGAWSIQYSCVFENIHSSGNRSFSINFPSETRESYFFTTHHHKPQPQPQLTTFFLTNTQNLLNPLPARSTSIPAIIQTSPATFVCFAPIQAAFNLGGTRLYRNRPQ